MLHSGSVSEFFFLKMLSPANQGPQFRLPTAVPSLTVTSATRGPASSAAPSTGRPDCCATYPDVTATPGLPVRHRSSGFTGVIAGFDGDGVIVRGTTGQERLFRPTPGAFDVEGRAVSLVRPAPPPAPPTPPPPRPPPAPTPSRISTGPGWRRPAACCRGRPRRRAHREGVGRRPTRRRRGRRTARRLDHLPEGSTTFSPGPGNRLGVLVDHLVQAARRRGWRKTLTPAPRARLRHALRRRVGSGQAGRRRLAAWAHIPQGTAWKAGVCRSLGRRRPRRGCGAGSSPACRPTPTSNPPSWAPSSGSSTSSPTPAGT